MLVVLKWCSGRLVKVILVSVVRLWIGVNGDVGGRLMEVIEVSVVVIRCGFDVSDVWVIL